MIPEEVQPLTEVYKNAIRAMARHFHFDVRFVADAKGRQCAIVKGDGGRSAFSQAMYQVDLVLPRALMLRGDDGGHGGRFEQLLWLDATDAEWLRFCEDGSKA